MKDLKVKGINYQTFETFETLLHYSKELLKYSAKTIQNFTHTIESVQFLKKCVEPKWSRFRCANIKIATPPPPPKKSGFVLKRHNFCTVKWDVFQTFNSIQKYFIKFISSMF